MQKLFEDLFCGQAERAQSAAAELCSSEQASITAKALYKELSSTQLERHGDAALGLWQLFSITLPELLKKEIHTEPVLSAVEKLYADWFTRTVRDTVLEFQQSERTSGETGIHNSHVCHMALSLLVKEWHFHAHTDKTTLRLLLAFSGVLGLPSKHCQKASLAGLGHLFLEKRTLDDRRRWILMEYMKKTDDEALRMLAGRALHNHAG